MFVIKVKEYPKTPITLKPGYFDHFNHGQIDVFDCGQNACFNNNYHSHFVSQFGIKVKEYPNIQLHSSLDNLSTLTMVNWMFSTASTTVKMDVFDHFNCGGNGCF